MAGLNFLYVDGSNYCLSASAVASVKHGLVPDVRAAYALNVVDPRWAPSLVSLLYFAGGKRSQIGRAVIFSSHLFGEESVWSAAEEEGFDLRLYIRGRDHREKQVNTSVVTEVMKDSYERMKVSEDEITLVTGSLDYVPLVQDLRSRGFKVRIMFWGNASRELREAASKFVFLDPWVDHLALKS